MVTSLLGLRNYIHIGHSHPPSPAYHYHTSVINHHSHSLSQAYHQTSVVSHHSHSPSQAYHQTSVVSRHSHSRWCITVMNQLWKLLEGVLAYKKVCVVREAWPLSTGSFRASRFSSYPLLFANRFKANETKLHTMFFLWGYTNKPIVICDFGP